MNPDALKKIKDILGPRGWVDPDDGAQFLTDVTGTIGESMLIARPASTEEVSAVVRVCADEGISIVPQGGNTNVCKMTVPARGQDTILLSLQRLNKIIGIDAAGSTATVEAGVTLQTLQSAAAREGRVFAPDWGARGTATVGGAVATNGGGLNVLRYGTTREQVLGMEVVLPDGSVLDSTRRLIKDNSGYDLKQLFIGSEGTLGIITKLVFRLHNRKPRTSSMFAAVSDLSHTTPLLALAKSLAGEGLIAFELLPGLGVEKALERYSDLRHPIPTRADWYILIRICGDDQVEDITTRLFELALEEGLLNDAAMSTSLSQESNLWEIREQMIPYQYFDMPMIKWDVSVPVQMVPQFITQANDMTAKRDPQAIPYAVSHLGDGNIHYCLFVEENTSLETRQEISASIDRLIWSMGGSIVAEHGVGAVFIDRVRKQKTAAEYTLMQTIKRSIDPGGIMNPGKLLRMD